MNKEVKDKINSIFNIPVNRSNIKDDDDDNSSEAAYMESSEQKDSETFDEKAEKLRNKIAELPEVDKNFKVPSDFFQESVIEQKPKESFAEILYNSILPQRNEPESNTEMVQKQPDNDTPIKTSDNKENDVSMGSEIEQSSGHVQTIINHPISDQNGWYLESPDPMFNSFYNEKKQVLSRILIGGKINFAEFRKELLEAKVDLRHSEIDIEMMSKKMSDCQRWKDRINHIRVICNSQYYPFKRSIILLQGLLARTFYDKPAQKQEGVNYLHLRDFEEYFTNLESLHENTNSVYQNLHNCYEMLSRQITVAMPSKSFEHKEVGTFNHSSKNDDNSTVNVIPTKVETKKSSDNSSYDKLDDEVPFVANNVVPVKSEKKKKEIDWL